MRRLTATVLALTLAIGLASVSVLAIPAPVMAACEYGPNVTRTKSQTITGYNWTSTVVYRVFSCNGVPADVYVVSMKLNGAVTDGSEPQTVDLMAFDSNQQWPSPPDHRYWWKDPNAGCNPYPSGSCTYTTGTQAVAKSGSYSTSLVAHYAGRIGFMCDRMVYHKFITNTIYWFCANYE